MESLFTLSPIILAAVPVVIGVTAAIREIGIPSKYAPLLAIAFGMTFMSLTGIVWQVAVVQGIIVGLMASGLWSGSKALFAPQDIIQG